MSKWLNKVIRSIGLSAIGLTCCSHAFADTARVVNPNDPYEPFNRAMYRFNDGLDKAIFKPIATFYTRVVPKPMMKGVSNVFSNIDTVPTVVNDVLQGNLHQATSDAWRLLINTTVGIGGFFDVAGDIGLEHNTEDLGLTFAKWGYKKSNYLVIPFIGPSTVRDGIAWPINYQFLTIYPYIYPVRTRNIIYGTSLVSKRADLLRFQNVMEQASLDKYVFMRNAYLQRRTYQIQRNSQLDGSSVEKNNLEDDTLEKDGY